MRFLLTTILTVAALAHADELDLAKGKARPIVVLSDSRDDPRAVSYTHLTLPTKA